MVLAIANFFSVWHSRCNSSNNVDVFIFCILCIIFYFIINTNYCYVPLFNKYKIWVILTCNHWTIVFNNVNIKKINPSKLIKREITNVYYEKIYFIYLTSFTIENMEKKTRTRPDSECSYVWSEICMLKYTLVVICR